jgi:ATP/maltotriose-dependent transcriptional regulator MalT/two-component SAPR family response regulator
MSQSIPISKTKIVVPNRRPELLSRPRLLEGLQALLDNKLILLSATAGYGKTSLMIDLAQHVDMPVCWLSLDLLDRDPQRFIAYLIASVTQRFPKVGKTSRIQLNQLKSIDDDEIESLLVTFTNEIYENIEDEFLLIIDDFHLLDDIPEISSLVNRFLELVVENCHVILSSRTLPSLADVTLMVAREQVAGISHVELEFSAREVQALYAQNYHQHLSDEAAQKFVSETGGWITGMVLSNLPDIPRVSGVDTFAYLGQQVLDQQPQDIREFLLRTSLPEEFNAEFCKMVLAPLHSEPQNWYDLMGIILEKNLFVLPLDTDGSWLRYHHLFREFLQTRLKEELPHEVRPILERMVKAYEKFEEWEKAYFTCKQLDDPTALAEVVERAGSSMLQSALVTLEGWLNSLPPSLVETRPGLISLRGPILAVKGHLRESIELLDQAVRVYRKKRDNAGLAIALVRRANTLRIFGDYAASLADINETLKITTSDLSLQLYYAEALRLKGLNLYRMGESRQAVESLEHSLSLYSAMNENSRIPTILMETGMVLGAVGDIDSARKSYQEALVLKQAESDLYTQAEILNNLAVLYHHIGEYELASETFESGIRCARKGRNRRAEALLLAGMGDLYGEVEEFDAASQAYRQAGEIFEGNAGDFITNYLIVAQGNLALAQGNLGEGNRIVKSFRKKIQSSQSAYERGLWALLEGRYYLLNKEPSKALVRLKECRELFTQDGRDLELLWSRVWLAAAYQQAGEQDNARVELQNVLAVSQPPDHALLVSFRQTLPWLKEFQNNSSIGRQLGTVIEKSQRLNTKLPAVRRTLRRHAIFIQVPSALLVIRSFGNPEVSVSGKVVQMADWRTQSVRDLFFYFLNRHKGVTKEQVGAALWPETRDSQTLKARFKNEIYRLRRAVGRDVVVFEDEYYRFNHQLDYDYDVDAFDSYILRAQKMTDTKARIEQLQKAVDLVHGPYLADVDAEWAVPEQERLGQDYSVALEELAYLYLNNNRLSDCLTICQLALKNNHFQETIYQIEMRAHAALGDRSAVARCYQSCRSAMESLGIPPTDETERLYQELIS